MRTLKDPRNAGPVFCGRRSVGAAGVFVDVLAFDEDYGEDREDEAGEGGLCVHEEILCGEYLVDEYYGVENSHDVRNDKSLLLSEVFGKGEDERADDCEYCGYFIDNAALSAEEAGQCAQKCR